MVEVKVAKNRVQPASSLQAKYFFLGHDGERIGGSPHFSLLPDFCHGLLAPFPHRVARRSA